MDPVMTFEDYAETVVAHDSLSNQRLNEASLLPHLEALGLRISYLIHTKQVQLPSDPIGDAVSILLAILTNELRGFSGCLRAGTLHAAYHNLRAMTELDTALHYIFADQALAAQRVSQFLEFGEMHRWLKRRALEVQLQEGKINQDEFNARCMVSPIMVAHATPERIASWISIFEVKNESKLLSRRYWHTGPIEQLFKAKDPTGRAFNDYEILCHAAHVSPLGQRLSNTTGPQLFGFSAMLVDHAIKGMFGHVCSVLTRVDAVLGTELLHETIPFRLAIGATTDSS